MPQRPQTSQTQYLKRRPPNRYRFQKGARHLIMDISGNLCTDYHFMLVGYGSVYISPVTPTIFIFAAVLFVDNTTRFVGLTIPKPQLIAPV